MFLNRFIKFFRQRCARFLIVVLENINLYLEVWKIWEIGLFFFVFWIYINHDRIMEWGWPLRCHYILYWVNGVIPNLSQTSTLTSDLVIGNFQRFRLVATRYPFVSIVWPRRSIRTRWNPVCFSLLTILVLFFRCKYNKQNMTKWFEADELWSKY